MYVRRLTNTLSIFENNFFFHVYMSCLSFRLYNGIVFGVVVH